MLDRQVIEILLYIEKKCRNFRIGEVDYSPEVSEAAEVSCAQRLALKVAEGKKSKRDELSRLKKKWDLNISGIENKWSIKMNIERSRREHLHTKAQQAVLRKNI